MKVKLIKDHGEYMLINDERFVIATTDASMLEVTDKIKLSKQNCDEIFGVVNVEKLAEEFVNDLQVASESVNRSVKLGYEEGFNKAMELNKDKVFTLEDVIDVVFKQVRNGFDGVIDSFTEAFAKECINKAMELYQPTEIEVEIEVTKSDDIKSVEKDWYKIGEPKLDENRCLILKKI
jgi:hypothetical protein